MLVIHCDIYYKLLERLVQPIVGLILLSTILEVLSVYLATDTEVSGSIPGATRFSE